MAPRMCMHSLDLFLPPASRMQLLHDFGGPPETGAADPRVAACPGGVGECTHTVPRHPRGGQNTRSCDGGKRSEGKQAIRVGFIDFGYTSTSLRVAQDPGIWCSQVSYELT